MFYQLKDRVRRYRFAGACKSVLQAAPVTMNASSSLVVLSQVQHKDVLLYLLAVKSFARQVRPRTVCVLNDGSLSANDRAVLREHIPGVNMLELAEFRSAICPRGGTWERLLAIASLVRNHYVIQLDSDTLTIGPIEEVRHCIEHQAAFALGTWNNQKIGAKWSEWGSEQVMSNIVIANIPKAIVLPHPKYADCHKMQVGVTEFIHFI